MNVCDYLLDGKPKSATALLTLQREYSYGDLRTAAYDVAAFLVNSGLRKGDRALLLADSGFFWAASYLGMIRAGVVCVPLSPKLAADELSYIIKLTEPKLCFAEAKHAARFPADGKIPRIVVDRQFPGNTRCDAVAFDEMRKAVEFCDQSLPAVAADDLGALMFTSGSTGVPRGVMISNRNIMANTDSIIQYLSLSSSDRIMSVLPFHYCFGASLLHTHLRVGGSIVIDPRFMYPEKVLERMRETGSTGFAGVPSHYQILLRKSNLARMCFPKLRYVQQAGGQLAPAFIKELQQVLPDTQVFIMYGQTEGTARLSYLPPALLSTKLGSVGKGIPGVTLSVVGDCGQPILPGQTGEIVAHGDNVALGYWRAPEETARCFREGKLYTGDLATVDEDGFIFIVDRAKDFLKCGGQRVSCRQLENILLEYESLLEAAVISVPDEILGEAPVAYVVARNPKAAPTAEQLDLFCRRRLPLALVPKHFVVVESLPKNTSGKIAKPLLRAQTTAFAAQ